MKPPKHTIKSPVLFYHVACMNHWESIMHEQCKLLAEANFKHQLLIGVGSDDFNRAPLHIAQSYGLNCPEIVARGRIEDHESPTVRAIELFVRGGHQGPIGYFHTKGASDPDYHKALWRGIMNYCCLKFWEDCLEDLLVSDATGFLWTDELSHFVGNFWWAKPSWIKKLSGFDWMWCDREDWNRRFVNEFWIGSNSLVAPERTITSKLLRNDDSPADPIWSSDWWTKRPEIRRCALIGLNRDPLEPTPK